MTEPVKEKEIVIEREEEIIEIEENNVNLEEGNSVLSEINLVLILSYLSLSAKECPSFEEIEERESRGGVLRSNTNTNNTKTKRQRQVNGFRAIERQSSKVNTKIRDCRHSRRL